MPSEKSYCVYMHTSPSGKSYIGLTKNYNQRCRSHESTKNNCVAFSRSIKKYGWGNFIHKILKDDLTLDWANYWEGYYISTKNTLVPNGYNLKSGGDVVKFSDATRDKISKSSIGKVLSIETRARISAAVLKRDPASLETRLKLAEAIGKRSKELRDSITKKITGKKRTDATKKIMSDIAKNRPVGHLNNGNGFKDGHSHSDEARKKMSISRTGKARSVESIEKMITKNNKSIIRSDGVEFVSIKAAAIAIGCSGPSISMVLSGKKKTIKGFTFKYKCNCN